MPSSSRNTSATELLKKVRKIEIKTKALSHQIFAGEYHSAFKGRGMAFSEVREYQWGDDVRSMDWNVTARLRAPYVKVYEEERELTVVLLVDVSRSGLFGTAAETKRERIAEIAAVLSFSAILNKMLELQPVSDGTDIGAALKFLTNAIKKKCTAFLLSDMLDADAQGNPRYEEALKVAVNRHDLSVIQVHDPRERALPAVGLVHIKDSESGAGAWIDTDSRKVRTAYERWFADLSAREESLFNKYQVDHVDIATNDDYVKGLMALFNRR